MGAEQANEISRPRWPFVGLLGFLYFGGVTVPKIVSAPNPEPASLTIPDVAAELNVSETTVKRLLASGELRYFKVRHLVRINPEDVEALKQRIVPATEDRIDAYVTKIVDSASELTPAQRDRLAALLAGAR